MVIGSSSYCTMMIKGWNHIAGSPVYLFLVWSPYASRCWTQKAHNHRRLPLPPGWRFEVTFIDIV